MNHQALIPQPPQQRSGRPSTSGLFPDPTKKANLGEDIDLVVGVTATALAADQLIKLKESKKHKAMHLAKAGLSTAAAATAFTMMRREHRERIENDKKRHDRTQRLSHAEHESSFCSDCSRSRSRSPSRSPSWSRTRDSSLNSNHLLLDHGQSQPTHLEPGNLSEKHEVHWGLVPTPPTPPLAPEEQNPYSHGCPTQSPDDYHRHARRSSYDYGSPNSEMIDLESQTRTRARTISPEKSRRTPRDGDGHRSRSPSPRGRQHHHRHRSGGRKRERERTQSTMEMFWEVLRKELMKKRD
ncbi:hypothetical protein QBC43DRAFT_306684 [Cladorrhinum sp. PSN259]|nr:hypothetical protein QBC43DRAFT_306684 [Cladorrhinum sp. PSN259]